MQAFETNPKSLKLLLTQIHNGEVSLPDFQRDFVWDPGAIEELIESIMREYPAGSLLFLKHGGEGFQVREFEGAPPLKSAMSTSYLVLDGQQRLTSLYQAFFGKGEHRFFLDINELAKGDDIEAAVWHESDKRSQSKGLLSLEYQAEKLICPLAVVMGDGFDSWIEDIVEYRPEKDSALKELRAKLRQVHHQWIQPILDYQFPVITLGQNTSLDAVCKMFETLNRRGVKLTVFELLMARSFANKVSLRSLWDKALEAHPILEQFDIDPYYVLQTISLMSAQTIKRKDILDMNPETVSKHWESATVALAEALTFLSRNAGVLTHRLLPYHTMLVPMAAVFATTNDIKGPKEASRKEKLEQWFWASVFAQTYETGPSSRSVSDFKELTAWIRESGTEPFALLKLHFNPEMFFDISPKQRALYRGCLALLIANGALDFHKAEQLDYDYLEKNKVDDHHVFPQNYLKKKGEMARANCILNRTLIDKKTNIRISDKAPSVYTKEIRDETGKAKLDRIFNSHSIAMDCLKSDDFEGFLRQRAQSFMDLLKDVLDREIPNAPTDFATIEDRADDEDEVRGNPRDRYSPDEINTYPSEILQDMPKSTEELYQGFISKLQSLLPDIWWKVRKDRIVFWSPSKVFASLWLSGKGLNFRVFTDGKAMDSVEPIVQKDRGGELWGRYKLRSPDDLDECMRRVIESHTRLKDAVAEGRATAWWAMSRKKSE
jgi:hypothetical protein